MSSEVSIRFQFEFPAPADDHDTSMGLAQLPMNDIIAQISAHEHALSGHRTALVHLKRSFNSRAKINGTIPPELLAEVLLHYTSTWDDGLELLSHGRDEPDAFRRAITYLLIPTQICHHWREVA